MSARGEARGATAVFAVLAASAVVVPWFPIVEYWLNVAAVVLGVVVGGAYVFLIVRDLWL